MLDKSIPAGKPIFTDRYEFLTILTLVSGIIFRALTKKIREFRVIRVQILTRLTLTGQDVL